MYDIFVSWLSPELMTQAEYINGALYLPVYPFFSEVISAVGALVCASFVFIALGVLSEIAWCIAWKIIRWKKSDC